MTKNDYIKQVAHLPREKQIEALEEMYKAECAINDYSEKAIMLCEILAIDYEIWSYEDILPHFYYDVGKYHECIKYAQKYADVSVLGITKCYLIANAYMALKDYNAATEYANRSNLLMFNLLGNNGQHTIDFSSLPKETLHEIASNYMIIGEALYNLKQYPESLKAFTESWEYYPTVKSAYYLGIISYDGLEVTKDVKRAETFLTTVLDNPVVPEFLPTANYKLGIIYAKEPGFINKAKAEEHLRKAQSCGYPISDAEIQQILSSIPQPKKKSFFSFFK